MHISDACRKRRVPSSLFFWRFPNNINMTPAVHQRFNFFGVLWIWGSVLDYRGSDRTRPWVDVSTGAPDTGLQRLHHICGLFQPRFKGFQSSGSCQRPTHVTGPDISETYVLTRLKGLTHKSLESQVCDAGWCHGSDQTPDSVTGDVSSVLCLLSHHVVFTLTEGFAGFTPK